MGGIFVKRLLPNKNRQYRSSPEKCHFCADDGCYEGTETPPPPKYLLRLKGMRDHRLHDDMMRCAAITVVFLVI